MSHIDERIVKMTFDNSSFEKGVNQTIQSLEKLNQVLKNTGNADAVNNLSKSIKDIKAQLNTLNLDELEKSTNKQSIWQKIGNGLTTAGKGISDFIGKLNIGDKLSSAFNKATDGTKGLSSAVETTSQKFSALGIMGATALANITNGAVNAGKRLLNSLTLEPITTGFSEYETKMNAISTILANTADEGATLDDVNKALNELNVYADDTIYNFAQMTENIGRFTSAGVNLNDSVAAIKGLSNLAAFFGVDATKASSAMYQMSQALASGKIQLMDWNSLVNAGMGGEEFQKALIRTSELMGTGADAAIKKYGSFRESLTKGEWLTGDVMIETLKQISGAYKESELRAQGYSATQAKAIVDMAKAATKSATEVRTVTGMIDAMKESVQSGWAISWEHILGDKEQATELLTGVKDAFESLITPATEARNKMLEFWNQNGGRDAVIKGLANTFKSLGKVMGSIGDAWKEVFPSMTGQKLVELSNKFKDFTEKLKVSDSTAKKIKDTFKGVFNVFKTIGSAVGSVIKAFSPLTSVFPVIGNAILSVTSAVGKFVTALSDAISKSQVFDKIANFISGAFKGIGNVFTNVGNGFGEFFSYIGNLDFSKAFDFIGKGFSGVGKALTPIVSGIGKAIGTIDFGTIMDAMKTGAFLNVLKTLKETFGEVSEIGESAKGVFKSFSGIGKSIKDTLDGAREALEAWQNSIKANMLLKIAASVGVLAGSLLILASIDGKKMASALIGMAAAMGSLSAAYIAMMKYGGTTGLLKKGIGGGILAIASSVLILAAAMKILSGLSPGGILTGITGVLAALASLAIGVKILKAADKDLRSSAASLVIFGVALMTIAGALKLLGGIDAETMGSGLFTMAAVLAELAIFLKVANFGELGKTGAASILALSVAVLALSQALKQFSQLDPQGALVGLAAMGAVLAEIGIFGDLMDTKVNLTKLAVGLAAMAVSLTLLCGVLKLMGSMDLATIGTGLLSMAGSLAVLGAAAELISGGKMLAVAGGVAAMSAALIVLGAAMHIIGALSWDQLTMNLIGIGVALTIFSIAANSMTSALPGAAAMLVVSAALLVMSGALAILTPQLMLLSTMSMDGLAVMLLALSGAFLVLGIAGLTMGPVIPVLLGLAAVVGILGVGCLAAGVGITAMGTGLGLVAAAIGASGMLIIEFVRQLLNLLPQLGLKAGEAMVNFATAIGNGASAVIGAWTKIMTELLNSIITLAPKIAETGVTLITEFAKALATGIPQLVSCGMEMIVGVLEGIAANIGNVVSAAADIIVNFINGIAANLGNVINAGINLALSFIEGVANGISSNSGRLEAAIRSVIQAMADAGLAVIRGAISGFTSGGKTLLQGFCNGVKSMMGSAGSAVKSCINAAKQAASNLGSALVGAGKSLIQGLVSGITSMASSVAAKAKSVVQGAVNAAKAALKINSPSKVFIEIGKFVDQGFIVGMDKYSKGVNNSATNLAEGVIDNIKNPLSNIAKMVNGEIDANPTITPVLDLSNVERNSRRLGDLVSGNGTLSLTTDKANLMTSSIGQIQNGTDNGDIVSALKDLKASLSDNRPSYTVNGITYDDGSNITSAVESLVRAAKIERRI